MNIFLWILQAVLAALFAFAGFNKIIHPQATEGITASTARFIGTAELLGVIGLIIPWLTGIAPVLTPLAAVALAVVIILAAGFHYRRNEYASMAFTVVVLVCCIIVAYFRF